MNSLSLTGLILIVFYAMVSCSVKQNKESLNFCNQIAVEDVQRIPLVFPYELSNISGTWDIYFSDSGFGSLNYYRDEVSYGLDLKSITNISLISIIDKNLIVLESVKKRYKDYIFNDTLFLFLDVKNNLRKRFIGSNLMNNYLLSKYKIKQYSWHNTDSLYLSFRKNRSVPWCTETTQKVPPKPWD